MRSATNGKTKRSVRALGLAAAILAAGLIAFPSPAQARDYHGKQRGHRKHVARHDGHRNNYQHVPRRFRAHERRAYHQYYRGRSYYRPHRHHHEVYRFPVYLRGRIIYQPYAYCGDQVFFQRPTPLPRLAFGVSFGNWGVGYSSGSCRH